MDLKDFKDDVAFQNNPHEGELLQSLDLNNPGKLVLANQSSVPRLLQQYMSCQAATNAQLIEFMGDRLGEVTLHGAVQTVASQQDHLSQIANKSNLLTRQMERLLEEHLKMQEGTDYDYKEMLIHEPPMGQVFGVEAKASDTGLRMISSFSGDSLHSNEADLTVFLREIYSLTQTNALTENAAVSVILRKVTGSAQVLLDDFVSKLGGPTEVNLRQLVAHLEKKFIIKSSPLHADAELHSIQQGVLTYSQLQAKIQRLVRLACRLESEERKQTLMKVKENAAFIMAISPDDRLLINGENSRRAGDNLTALSLDQMSDFLSKAVADRLNYESINNVTPVLDHQGLLLPQPINYAQRGSFRGRGRFRGAVPSRGGQSGQRGAVNNFRYSRRGQFEMKRGARKQFVTTDMAGVDKNCCLLCGSPGHGFKDANCPYAGAELMPSPCRQCRHGAHATATCKEKHGNGWPAQK